MGLCSTYLYEFMETVPWWHRDYGGDIRKIWVNATLYVTWKD